MQKHLWNTKLTANDSSPKEEVGIIRVEYDRANKLAKIYRYVKNGSGGSLANGDVVVWDLTADDAYTVTTTTTANALHAAGVAIGAISNGYYGWIQVGGIHPAVKLDGSSTNIAAGDAIGTYSTAKKGGKTTTANAGIGFALDAISSDTTGEVFLRGLI